MKKTIRLSESDLHRVIKESIKGILSEGEAWANQPPIDKFHPDWWYYRQEVEPEGLEDFDPCMDSSDEEYDEHLRQKFGESKLRRVVKESVRRIINEDYKYDAFLKARKLYKDFNDFINLVKNANNEVKGAYSDKLKILIDAQGIMSEFAFTSEGGNEGCGFSSDGVGCF